MLLALAIVLAVVWFFGFAVFHVTSAAIHVLIIAAVIAGIVYAIDMLRGGRGGRRTIAPPL